LSRSFFVSTCRIEEAPSSVEIEHRKAGEIRARAR
jgi:hypothetical protein